MSEQFFFCGDRRFTLRPKSVNILHYRKEVSMTELFAGLLGILVGFIVLLVLFVMVIYNKIGRLSDTARSIWSEIEIQFRERHGLVPNLVECVKRSAPHESTICDQVSQARSMAMRASSLREKAKDENRLKGTLNVLFTVTEASRELNADANFMLLKAQFKELEDKIDIARKHYNAVVRDLNILFGSFPSNIIASSFKVKKDEFLELESQMVTQKPSKTTLT